MSRKAIKIKSSILNFEIVETENIPMILSAPISFGLCHYGAVHALSLEDFYNMNEILSVKFENERRAQKAAERKK